MSATMPIDAGPAWYHTREYLTGRPLTPLELWALRLAADGLSDAEIGARLGCSEDMAGQALHRAAWKLNTRGRAGAVAQGYLRGLLKPPPRAEQIVQLPHREEQVLRLYAEGLTDEQIADRLGLRLWTVHSYGKRLRKRLGARDRAHAVRRSLETGALHLVAKHAGDDRERAQ